MSVIKDLKPHAVWKYFEEISQIPRCSKHEDKIRQYLIDFAKHHKLNYKTDKAGNVVITKPATPGMEKKPIVVLQSHMDMVCEKNSDVHHDFSTDPIKFKRKDDILTADGTSLGADDGIGIATTLAIFDDATISHGPLEGLFTVDEETGLTGAFALATDMLKGRIMLNIDSEDFGVITIGCAGGGNSTITLPISQEKTPDDMFAFTLKLFGLRGGHSGVDINEQRGNAIKIVTRLLWKTMQKYTIHLAEIDGGDKHNAIPREATAKIVFKRQDADLIKKLLQREVKDIQNEILPIDPKLQLDINKTDVPIHVFNNSSMTTILHLLHALPHGVDKMSYDISDLVETSTNLATVKIKDSTVEILLSTRSSIMSALQDFRDRIHAIAVLAGAMVQEDEPYPGWKPNLDSKLLKKSKQLFQKMYDTEPKVEAIHAGLECGIIGEKYPGMDMISIGPTIKYPHSPEEQVHISTVDKFHHYILKILEEI
jgi:dipeptidase D